TPLTPCATCEVPPPVSPAAACPEEEANATSSTGDDVLELRAVRFADLPGWSQDRQAEAIPALLASCGKIATLADRAPLGVSAYGGRARDWRAACARARRLPAGDDDAARALFEAEF